MSGFFKRVLTAIVFVVVMVGGVYLHPASHFLLFIVIAFLSLWEYFDLTLPTDNWFRKWVGMLLGMLPILLTTIWISDIHTTIGLTLTKACLLLLPAISLSFVFELYTNSENPYTNIGIILLGLLYIGIPFSLVPLITFKSQIFQPNIIFGLLLLTWANDTGAYVIGSQIGKTKLFPRISPKKTWEGSLGGVIVTFIIAYLLSLFFNDLSWGDWLVLAGIVSIFGSIGDLVESMLKRSLHIKDSGKMLPGHGGMLDRFDAFIFLLPFAGAYLLWNT